MMKYLAFKDKINKSEVRFEVRGVINNQFFNKLCETLDF